MKNYMGWLVNFALDDHLSREIFLGPVLELSDKEKLFITYDGSVIAKFSI